MKDIVSVNGVNVKVSKFPPKVKSM